MSFVKASLCLSLKVDEKLIFWKVKIQSLICRFCHLPLNSRQSLNFTHKFNSKSCLCFEYFLKLFKAHVDLLRFIKNPSLPMKFSSFVITPSMFTDFSGNASDFELCKSFEAAKFTENQAKISAKPEKSFQLKESRKV